MSHFLTNQAQIPLDIDLDLFDNFPMRTPSGNPLPKSPKSPRVPGTEPDLYDFSGLDMYLPKEEEAPKVVIPKPQPTVIPSRVDHSLLDDDINSVFADLSSVIFEMIQISGEPKQNQPNSSIPDTTIDTSSFNFQDSIDQYPSTSSLSLDTTVDDPVLALQLDSAFDEIEQLEKELNDSCQIPIEVVEGENTVPYVRKFITRTRSNNKPLGFSRTSRGDPRGAQLPPRLGVTDPEDGSSSPLYSPHSPL